MTVIARSPDAARAEVACERGTVRGRNEDAARVDTARGVYVVADGVGGQAGGHIASQVAVDAVHDHLDGRVPRFDTLGHALLAAHHAIRQRGREQPRNAGMATTIVAAQLNLDAGTLLVAHVGDSRAYLRADGRLRRLTHDHGLGSVLTQALGQQRPPEPEVVEVPLRSTEKLLLVTDGITDVLDDAEVARHLAGDDVTTIRDHLVDGARTSGTRDNYTVVAVDLSALTDD